MKSGKFLDEFGFWLLLAIGVSFFTVGFRNSGKVLLAKGPSGLQEAFAA